MLVLDDTAGSPTPTNPSNYMGSVEAGYRYVLYVNGVEVGAWNTQMEAIAEARKAKSCTWTIWREQWRDPETSS